MFVGYMFFSSSGSSPPKLERSALDGSGRKTLIDSKIVYPYGVSLDIPNRLDITLY